MEFKKSRDVEQYFNKNLAPRNLSNNNSLNKPSKLVLLYFFFPCSLSLHARTSLVALACCQGFTPISFALPLCQIASLAATAKSHTAGPSAAGEDADDGQAGGEDVVLPVDQLGA